MRESRGTRATKYCSKCYKVTEHYTKGNCDCVVCYTAKHDATQGAKDLKWPLSVPTTIYIFRHPNGKHVKIGQSTKGAEWRLNQWNSGRLPSDHYTMLTHWPGTKMDERNAHLMFDNARIPGTELFELTPELKEWLAVKNTS